jgi:hypothetical protein
MAERVTPTPKRARLQQVVNLSPYSSENCHVDWPPTYEPNDVDGVAFEDKYAFSAGSSQDASKVSELAENLAEANDNFTLALESEFPAEAPVELRRSASAERMRKMCENTFVKLL